MQYNTIEELTLELALYPNKKIDILEDNAKPCEYGWFAVAKDGNCALFDDNGELDDISKVKSIKDGMIPKFIEKIIIPDSVTDIEHFAFSNTYLKSIYMPDSVTNIDRLAFENNVDLVDIRISNSLQNIEGWAFYNCQKIKEINLPAIVFLHHSAFNSCFRLSKVTLGKDLRYVGRFAFSYCRNLKELVFKGKTLEKVKSMENYPFSVKDESIIKCER